MLEKPVTLTAASLAAGIWQLAAQGNMYPAWALLPREVTVGGADSTRKILGHRLIHSITANSPTQLVGNTGLAF